MNISLGNRKFVYYQDKFFYYFRKPAGLASTRGKSVSFLDLMCDSDNDEISNIVQSQMAFFGKEKELGLLNRLDGATTGLLYFAKNPRVYFYFREMQKEMRVNKFYVAEVYGDVHEWIERNGNKINFPIMHHRFSADRMVVICNSGDESKGKGNIHNVETEIVDVDYLIQENHSVLMLKIKKGIRHQIRAHLSSIGFPICGDKLYCQSKKQDFDKIQLFSVGMEM